MAARFRAAQAADTRRLRTCTRPVSTPVVAAVMQYMANVLGSRVAGARKQPEHTASSSATAAVSPPRARHALRAWRDVEGDGVCVTAASAGSGQTDRHVRLMGLPRHQAGRVPHEPDVQRRGDEREGDADEVERPSFTPE